MSSNEKFTVLLFVVILFVALGFLVGSCSVLAVTAGKAKSSISQTTTTTTVVDSVNVSPHFK